MGSIAWHEQGDRGKPSVLFLHGFMGSHRDWGDVIGPLAADFHCVSVDLPGHGDTAISARDTFANTAAALVECMDDLDADTFSIVGYSMGGRLALYLATHYSMRVDAVVIESASPGLATEKERTDRRQSDENIAARLEEDDFDDFLKAWYDQPLFASMHNDAKAFAEMIDGRCNNEPQGLAMALRQLGTGAQVSLWDELPDHLIPTLIITGEADKKFCRLAEEMAAACPAMTVEIVPGCGHNVHWEQALSYASRVKAFLKH